LGPPKKKDSNQIKDMVNEVFRQAQSGNMEQFESSHDGDSPSFRSFTGTGYRLGQSEDDSVAIPSGSKGKKPEEETVTVKVYKQGFTVDDGELRSYEDPRNREFFESITRNEIPVELRKQSKGMVHVNVENHLSDDFVKKTPKFKAFTGSGHTLGSPAPPTLEEISTTVPTTSSAAPKDTNAENEAKASSNINVNQDEPTTMISIRLNDGHRLSARFNLTHTIQDIRRFVETARPEYSGRNYTLLTTFPNKELTNPEDTIQQAGLQNAAILQRLK
jgi:UBX domain-containing protein 1